jgi:hypothetical protein
MSFQPATTRRAFALPMVILVMVVVSLTISVSLARFSAQQRVVDRQIRAYQEHHAGRGLQEAIGAWLRQQNGRDLFDVLDPDDGHAMDIELDDGSIVSVFLRDGQGSALSNLTGRTEREINEGEDILRELARNVSQHQYLEMTRPFGPLGISASSAPELLISNTCNAIMGGNGRTLADGILEKRQQSGRLTRVDITQIASTAGISSDERAEMQRVFATDIELWAVIVEVRAGSGALRGRLVSRYGGITRIRLNSGRRNSSNLMELGAFITWKDLGVERSDPDLADLY